MMINSFLHIHFLQTKWFNDDVIEQRILLPGLSHIGTTLSFADWLTHWNLLAMNSPSITQELLYKLGYVDRYDDDSNNFNNYDLGITYSNSSLINMYKNLQKQSNLTLLQSYYHYFFTSIYDYIFGTTDIIYPRQILKVTIIGDNGVGKSSLIWSLSGLRPPGIGLVEMSVNYEKYTDSIVVGGSLIKRDHWLLKRFYQMESNNATEHSSSSSSSINKDNLSNEKYEAIIKSMLTPYFYISYESIPLDHIDEWMDENNNMYKSDLIVLMFQCGNQQSYEKAIQLEEKIPSIIPRMFIASKIDLIPMPRNQVISTSDEYGNINLSSNDSKQMLLSHERILQSMNIHLQTFQLPSLCQFSTSTNEGVLETTHKIIEVLLHPTSGLRTTSSYNFYNQNHNNNSIKQINKNITNNDLNCDDNKDNDYIRSTSSSKGISSSNSHSVNMTPKKYSLFRSPILLATIIGFIPVSMGMISSDYKRIIKEYFNHIKELTHHYGNESYKHIMKILSS